MNSLMVGSYLSYFAFAEVNSWHCTIFSVPEFGFSMVIFWIVTTHSYSSKKSKEVFPGQTEMFRSRNGKPFIHLIYVTEIKCFHTISVGPYLKKEKKKKSGVSSSYHL